MNEGTVQNLPHLGIVWVADGILAHSQFPELVWHVVAHRAEGMAVPPITENIYIILDQGQKGILCTEDVCGVRRVQETVLLQAMDDIVLNAGDSIPHITPQAFNSGKKKLAYIIFRLCLTNYFIHFHSSNYSDVCSCCTLIVVHVRRCPYFLYRPTLKGNSNLKPKKLNSYG